MSNEISVQEVAAHTIAVVRGRMKIAEVPQRFGSMLDQVWAVIRSGKLEKHGHNVFVYRPSDAGETDLEFGVQVRDRFSDVGDVVCSQTPAGRAAVAVHYGPYEQLPSVHDAVARWCHENGQARANVNWEVYGDYEEDPAKRRTDVFHLLAE